MCFCDRQARQDLGEDLDLFVVNSFGSLAQGLFVFLLLPAMTALRGMSVRELPGYLAQGVCSTLSSRGEGVGVGWMDGGGRCCWVGAEEAIGCVMRRPAYLPAHPPSFCVAGWQCFRGLTPACGSDCSGAPLLPLLYIAFNMAFNVSGGGAAHVQRPALAARRDEGKQGVGDSCRQQRRVRASFS